jgi:uracil-DNA glycosylase
VASRPDELTVVADEAAGCTRCDLERPTLTVFGEGPTAASLTLVGEQPGDQEDQAGRPFVGPAGRLLDDGLVAAGVDRTGLYVTNAAKHFTWTPRGKRRIHERPNARLGVPAVVTVHPSSIIRIQDAEEREARFTAFVRDLRLAADTAGVSAVR